MQIKLTDDFIKSLKKFDKVTVSRIFLRFERIRQENFGDFKNLSGGLFELRFSFGVRVYYSEIKSGILILALLAGTKNTKKEQSADIEKALKILRKEMSDGNA